MKHTIAIIFAGLAFAAMANATPTTCPTATLLQYEGLFGAGQSCAEGNLLFGNFHSSTFGTILVDPGSVLVTPFADVGGETGLDFGVAMSVKNQDVSDITIFYLVSGPVTDLTLSFNGSVTGHGISNVIEQGCVNGFIDSCPKGSTIQLAVTNPPPSFTNMIFSSGIQYIDLAKDVLASGGCVSRDDDCRGTAAISQVSNGFSTSDVPEPTTLLLIGGGLLAIGLARKILG